MKFSIFFLLLFSTISGSILADNPPNNKGKTSPFSFNPMAIDESLKDLDCLENAVKKGDIFEIDSLYGESESKITKAVFPQTDKETTTPGKIPSFLWSFVLSAAGTYTIYGAVLGPISVLVVYFASQRNKKEVRKSLWGWITGTIVGFGLWLLIKSLKV